MSTAGGGWQVDPGEDLFAYWKDRAERAEAERDALALRFEVASIALEANRVGFDASERMRLSAEDYIQHLGQYRERAERYRVALEWAERAIDEVLAQPMPGGLVDLHGGGVLRGHLLDARTSARAVLNPPEES